MIIMTADEMKRVKRAMLRVVCEAYFDSVDMQCAPNPEIGKEEWTNDEFWMRRIDYVVEELEGLKVD